MTGCGKITIRGRAEISEDGREIVITEVPYQQTRERLAKEKSRRRATTGRCAW
jgi:DNA gyrase/topoisomerase IV subunit A